MEKEDINQPSTMSTPLRRSARIAARNASMPSALASALPLASASALPLACPPLRLLRATVVAPSCPPIFHTMDQAVAETCAAIRRIINVVKERAVYDELVPDAIVSLMRAVWAIEDALAIKMKRGILINDKTALQSIPSFLALLKAVAIEANKDADVFSHYRPLPRSLVVAAQTIGTTIQTSFFPR